jgi:cytochrome o ubiquinol oxidase subunit III
MQNMQISSADLSDSAQMKHPDHLEIRTFGFWIYLMSDLIIFSILFATFAVLGRNYAGGPAPKQLFDLPYLFVETMLLLTSSVTFGFAMVFLQREKKQQVLVAMLITFVLGLSFVGMEIHEFYGMITTGAGPERSGFLSSFFTLVGTHGTHVSFGLIWMTVMIIQLVTKGLTAGVRSRLARLGLFWHFLDIIWVGVFTVVYLLGIA